MLVADLPKFDVVNGIAKKKTVAWIVIPSIQYARLRVAISDTGPGYVAKHWVDFNSAAQSIACSKGAPGNRGATGARGVMAPERVEIMQASYKFNNNRGLALGMYELPIPAFVSRTLPFHMWFDVALESVTQQDVPGEMICNFFEVPASVDVVALGFSQGPASQSYYTHRLLAEVSPQIGVVAQFVVTPFAVDSGGLVINSSIMRSQRFVKTNYLSLLSPTNRLFMMMRGSGTSVDANGIGAQFTVTPHFLQ